LPTKERWRDDNNITGVLHPHFSHNGKNLVWGQLLDYKAKPGRSNQSNMGIWEMKVADFKVDDIGIGLENIRTYAPGRQKKWYETHGFSPNDKKIIFSGSLVPGQLDVYMDIYTFDLFTEELTRLTRTLNKWDEHAHYFPDGKRIVWISSVNKFDPDNWRKTLRTEYFVMNADGSNKQQLTFFNTPGHDHSRIFNGQRVIVADSAFNSDGTELMASIAVEGETCYCENNAG
jgi:hypothetical protein